ncbi:efflux RND transporter periplasmic adaptor subunit [Chroococcidiopsis sp. CCMEE 29]|uniref:efflux RND transporter periplasmic adaptor subunit n=1 Tax=Chroococcidiopsis sp. CCMEE 29 TaxID=155894 RepID=UPI0020215A29|nr:efflux RND transporter periplasmic adaptor subunit [Chroococcidiopsis sp. CCMEE 29]
MNDESALGQKAWESEAAASRQRFNLRRWGWVSLSGILLLSGLSIGVPRFTSNDPRDISAEPRMLSVKTTQVAAVKSYTARRTYTGEVAAVRASELGFERSGKVVQFNVGQGDRVKAGMAIARVDTQNLEAQRLQLLAQKAQAVAVLQELQNGPRLEVIAAARAQVTDLQSQLELERIRQTRREYLYKEGAISKEQLDEVAFNQNALSARLVAAQSRLNELEAGTRSEQIAAQQAGVKQLEASIADLEIAIAKSTISAPFSGAIAKRHLDEGTVVQAGQSVVRLVEGITPKVEIGVPTEVASQLERGSEQRVHIGGETYQAKVTSILPEVNPTTRTRTVILALDTRDLQPVAPKQIARLEVTQRVPTNGYWLPITALARGDRGLWSCYALGQPEGNSHSAQAKTYRVERRDVEVLYTESDRALVRGLLQPGDTVIVDGTQRVVPGQLVRLVNSTRSS